MRIQQLTKKFKKNQSGRSMVEMLGVLAIMGVLSVGGVAGYRYGMERIRVNQIKVVIDRFMLSYLTERAKPAGESPYDDTRDVALEYFCDQYLGKEFCGIVTDRDYKRWVDGRITGANAYLKYPQLQVSIDYQPKDCGGSNIGLVFENRMPKSVCYELAETVKNTYGDLICRFSYGSGGTFPVENYEAVCDASGGNMWGFQLPW